MSKASSRFSSLLYLGTSAAVTYLALGSPFKLDAPGIGDLPYFLLIALHFLWGVVLLFGSLNLRPMTRARFRRQAFAPELLGAASLLLFFFLFIYALNANMPYVQRFIATGGNVRLALDTRSERTLVWIRVFPLVGVNVLVYLLVRLRRPHVRTILSDKRRPPDRIVRPYALLFVVASALLGTIAMPSFVSLEGFPVVGWIAWVPLFLVFRTARFGHGVFYGIVFGALSILLPTYWLGTFALVSLPVAVLIFMIFYAAFTPIALLLYRWTRFARPLVLPLAFTALELARSSGFLGFPWALAAHSQYSVLPLVQMTEVTGVWGLSFLVLFGNSVIAELVGVAVERVSSRRRLVRVAPAMTIGRAAIWLAGGGALVGIVALAGTMVLRAHATPDASDTVVTVAQVQQNNDPRKSDYEQTFETLMRLTDQAMSSDPDLVVWSETAFVPNIRRWSVDSSSRRYYDLVHRFLDYQKSLGTWLLTGNDDYETVESADRTEARYDYNASVLFAPDGERRQTYRKMRLVPFTEYFPFRAQLPWLYDVLISFGVELWEPGTDVTVFEHPLFTFSTPICFEDTFPSQVRKFVNAGADAILNLSNDFWSLTEVEAKQHLVAGLFRAVENRRPLLRTTASGATVSVDPYGRILKQAPYYESVSMVSELRIPGRQRTTIYTRLGDYFPIASAGVLLILLILSLAIPARSAPPVPAAGRPSPRAQAPTRRPAPPPQPPKSDTRRRRKKQKMSWRELWDD